LAGFNRERQTAFSPYFQTKRNGLFNIFDGLRFRLPLADATRNGRTLHHPNSILIPVNGHGKFHNPSLLKLARFFKPFPVVGAKDELGVGWNAANMAGYVN
jgi:hypothetical protein